MKQRTQKYNDLRHAVQTLRYANDETPIGNVFLKMYLIESGQIKFEQYKVIIHRMKWYVYKLKQRVNVDDLRIPKVSVVTLDSTLF